MLNPMLKSASRYSHCLLSYEQFYTDIDTALLKRLYLDNTEVTLLRMKKISTVTFSPVASKDENQERGNWDSPVEFFLSCLGYAVGLGNVWRFPYLCYRNGGGAFLIPYLIMLFFCGLPLMFMELALGQYASQGPLTVWKLSPLFKGIGISMVSVSCILTVYYNMITGWAIYYLYLSVRTVLPWACCEKPWATENCVSFAQKAGLCPADSQNLTAQSLFEETVAGVRFAAEDFFHNHVLQLSDGLENVGNLQWPLILSLLVAWLIVFAVLMRGVKSFGKTVYFTSTFPYLILTILLIRGAVEPGASDGIRYYLTPNWTKLSDARVWGDAASQIFYSTGVCFGGVITLASYNQFKNNIYRDALVVALGNSLTSIYSGFVVFSILGFMAHSQNTTVDSVATDGPGLTFIAYPQAVTLVRLSPLWSVLFFLMLVTLALSSMFPNTENIVCALVDQFPKVLRPFKLWITASVCLAAFLTGLLLTSEGGMYILQLLDTYGVGYALLFIGLAEASVVSWIYGARRLAKNIERMLGHRPTLFIWKYIWTSATPALLIFAIVFTIVQLKPLQYGDYVFPAWANNLGWCLTCVSLIPIPAYAIYKIVKFSNKEGKSVGLQKCIQILVMPSEKWGPSLSKFRFDT